MQRILTDNAKQLSNRVYMRDNLACKNKYLCPFLSFPLQTCVVYRLHYSGTKGRPEVMFRSEMKTPINLLKNYSFPINFSLVSCGNRYELVLEQNSFRYHVTFYSQSITLCSPVCIL